MSKNIHIIPVGFDSERLFQPISRGDLDADEIILLYSERESSEEEAKKLAEKMLANLEQTFDTVLGKDVTRVSMDDIFKFEDAYPRAYNMIKQEADAGNHVWVNISSMPRTVAFAFASAANTIVVENPELRNNVHTYYVSPQKYLVTKMISELEEENQFLNELQEDYDDERIEERQKQVGNLLDQVWSSGITKGAREMEDDSLHVEFPAVPSEDLNDFEKTLVHFLYKIGKTESTSELARKLRDSLDEETDEKSFKSKVQYNIKQLESKGFIKRTEVKNRSETELSTMGQLWVETHPEN